jgi:EAL domain-containing protein (putative c-di-GMP-specific phosphodiesterase class I)/ActR/RegA family two-component response regulator
MESGSADASGLRILVVEDQRFQRWAVEQILRAMGAAAVYSAEDGRQALELLHSVRPPIDIIVTDLNMPGMDGIQFIRHVGQANLETALLVVSAQQPALIASVATMAEAYGVRLLDAIAKPFSAQKFAVAFAHYRDPAVASAAPRTFTLTEIDAAVRNGEFEPYFQAKVVLATGEVAGAEALARWRHPRHGLVMPDSFIPALESNGRIAEMTLHIASKAAAACRTWRDAGFRLTVSVNMSPSTLDDVTLCDRLDELVVAAGLVPSDVILEVTETAAISHLGHVLENLARLRMKGFGLAIDDYGIGYASMQQLSRIPFTELKIDRSFLENAAAGKAGAAMLESSLEMANKLRITAVAEGVDSKEQLELLCKLGCPMAQGYYLGEPLAARDFAHFLAQRADGAARG